MNVDIITISLGFCQCYILKGDGIIVIDAGEPNKGAVFAQALEKSAINPHDVKLIVLTHGHWDHIGSASEIKSITGATLAMHSSEVLWLENSLTPLPPGVTTWGKVFIALHKIFLPLIKVPASPVEHAFHDDGLSLEGFGIPGRVIHTPGHSRGSSTVLLDTGEAFVGDLAVNKFPLRMSPGLPIFAEDSDTVVKSWKTLIELGATMIYPAHGRPFPISFIQKKL